MSSSRDIPPFKGPRPGSRDTPSHAYRVIPVLTRVKSFLNNRSDSSSNLELDSEDSDESDDDSFGDEDQLPPEYYLAQTECLDVSQL